MPEGDTVYRSAQTLARALNGQTVSDVSTTAPGVRSAGDRRLVGQTVAMVEARGKHLLMWFDPSGLALHTHLRMNGAWHLYRHGERWRRSPRQARFVVATSEWVAVCFAAPVCELLGPADVERHGGLTSLGPDALDATVDLVEARRRLDARADWGVGEALLDQRVLAGTGNVYKSEVCHLVGVDPWFPVAEVAESKRDALLEAACRLLRLNAGPDRRPRTTTSEAGADRVAVYGKAGRGCARCGEVIRVARQGHHARLTYWCPGCQGGGPRVSDGRSSVRQTPAC